MLHELSEGHPSRCVHVQMVLVLDELLVHRIRLDAVRAKAAGQELDEFRLEIGRVVRDVLAGMLAND